MGERLTGKVAFITGAARGQGREHALTLAREGADIIAVDICAQIDTVPYPLASRDDLAETVDLVKATGRRIWSGVADVRDEDALRTAFLAGVDELGPPEIVIANAGIAPMALVEAPNAWADVIEVNLTGVFHTVEVAIDAMVQHGRGGSIVLTSSTAGLNGICGPGRGGRGYTAAKHGVVGLMRVYANDLARHSIRVNSIHPTGVSTAMVMNDAMKMFLENSPALEGGTNLLPVSTIEARDVSSAVLWLVTDESRYVTGITLPIDAGFTVKK